MKQLTMILFWFSIPSMAQELPCGTTPSDLDAIASYVQKQIPFSFEWKRDSEFVMKGAMEFPASLSVNDIYSNYVLNATSVKSITHSKACVKTLDQTWANGRLSVKAQKCAFCGTLLEKCAQSTVQSNCTLKETSTESTLTCVGVPDSTLRSHSTVISCRGKVNEKKVCAFELTGTPIAQALRSSRTLAIGGAAESLYRFYGLQELASQKKFSESDFEKSKAYQNLDRFYQTMKDDSERTHYP